MKGINDLQFKLLATQYGMDIAVAKSVLKVESRGEGFDKEGNPKILFEGHQFHKFTKGKFDKTNPTISYPKWTTKYYNMNQQNRLIEAAGLDYEAALKCTSWGLGQVMGFNYKIVGYADVESFCKAMFDSEYLQAKAMFDYIKNTGLLEPLKNINKQMTRQERLVYWRIFAKGYNGPGYASNKYDTKLEDSYATF